MIALLKNISYLIHDVIGITAWKKLMEKAKIHFKGKIPPISDMILLIHLVLFLLPKTWKYCGKSLKSTTGVWCSPGMYSKKKRFKSQTNKYRTYALSNGRSMITRCTTKQNSCVCTNCTYIINIFIYLPKLNWPKQEKNQFRLWTVGNTLQMLSFKNVKIYWSLSIKKNENVKPIFLCVLS